MIPDLCFLPFWRHLFGKRLGHWWVPFLQSFKSSFRQLTLDTLTHHMLSHYGYATTPARKIVRWSKTWKRSWPKTWNISLPKTWKISWPNCPKHENYHGPMTQNMKHIIAKLPKTWKRSWPNSLKTWKISGPMVQNMKNVAQGLQHERYPIA